MRADGTACRVLAAAAAGICATLAGCATGAGAQAPAPGAATHQAQSQRPGHLTRPSQRPAADTAARSGRPSAQPQPAVRRKIFAKLTSGLYTDGPDGAPHYDLSFTSGPGGVLTGSASFLYQDGRISTAGSYTGTLSGSGKITLTLGDGKALSGSYAAGRLNLAGCAATLPLATFAGGCTFTYHGHVP